MEFTGSLLTSLTCTLIYVIQGSLNFVNFIIAIKILKNPKLSRRSLRLWINLKSFRTIKHLHTIAFLSHKQENDQALGHLAFC